MDEILAVLIHSSILDEIIVFQINPDVRVKYEEGRVVYFPSEISEMKEFDPEQIKAFHMVKKTFSPLGPLGVKTKPSSAKPTEGVQKEVLF